MSVFKRNKLEIDFSIEKPWITIAKKELEVSEVPGSGNNPRILEYHRATSLKATEDAVPWCAAFVCWCLEQSGIVSTRSAAARSYMKYGEKMEEYPVGAIVVLSRGSNPAQGHVGFIMGVKDRMIDVLGGNQGDKVCIEQYPKSRVVAVRWPRQITYKL